MLWAPELDGAMVLGPWPYGPGALGPGLVGRMISRPWGLISPVGHGPVPYKAQGQYGTGPIGPWSQ